MKSLRFKWILLLLCGGVLVAAGGICRWPGHDDGGRAAAISAPGPASTPLVEVLVRAAREGQLGASRAKPVEVPFEFLKAKGWRRTLATWEGHCIRETVVAPDKLAVRILEEVAAPGTPAERVLKTEKMAQGRVVVRFKGAPGGIEARLAALGFQSCRRLTQGGIFRVNLKAGQRVEEALLALRASGLVAYAEPDWIASLCRTPSDKYYGYCWSLNNTGQTGGTSGCDIHAPSGWDVATGNARVVVAVIDTGIDYTHPDLAGNMWVNLREKGKTAGTDNDGNGYNNDVYGYDFCNYDSNPRDDHGHGTHCAGIIGARGNNGAGITGVCWTVKLMALKAGDYTGSLPISAAVEAIDYARVNGARVINASWGSYSYDAALYDVISAANDAGILFVAAAGNDGIDNDNDPFPMYPAAYDLPNIVAVAATDSNDDMAWFSNYGLTTVSLGAPGVDIPSTLPTKTTAFMSSNGLYTSYDYMSGTSMAAPHVTGAAALLLAHNLSLSAPQIKSLMLEHVDPAPALSGLVATDGRLNVASWFDQGLMLAWGANSYGQLGDGTKTMRLSPVLVRGLDNDIAGLAIGDYHTVAVLQDGTVQAWGANSGGQLGNGTTAAALVPTHVPGLADVTAVAAGSQHSLALLADGTVKAWGKNSAGQLGNNSTATSLVPITVPGLSGVTAIAAGREHSVALLNDGSVVAWGRNSYGQLGDGSNVSSRVPVSVWSLGGPVTAIAAGAYHTLALLQGGALMAWGKDTDGQLGDGYKVNQWVPTAVQSLGGSVKAIAAGEKHSLALLDDGNGTVQAWGGNAYGQLGTGDTVTWTSPQTVILGADQIAAGRYHTAVRMSAGGNVWTWGSNSYGQLGDGTKIPHSSPAPTDAWVVELRAGGYHTVVWGYHGGGSGLTITPLENGVGLPDSVGLDEWKYYSFAVPAGTTGLVVETSGSTADVDLYVRKSWVPSYTEYDFCPYTDSGDESVSVDETTAPPLCSGTWYIAVNGYEAGDYTITATAVTGSPETYQLMAWGDNSYGQLGDGTTTGQPSPTAITSVAGIRSVAAGHARSMAVLADGTVRAWGLNFYGEFGNGTKTSSLTPVAVYGLANAKSVRAGVHHSLALTNDGTLKAWGNNWYGQLGDNTYTNRTRPVTVRGLGNVKAVSAGYTHSLAVLEDGTVWAWGDNYYGELGLGPTSTSTRIRVPTMVPGLNNVRDVAAGYHHSVALFNDGTVWTWGINWYGQLGDGTWVSRVSPAKVGLTGAVAISAGDGYTLAVLSDGTAYAWGDNFYGQLGDGTTNEQDLPVIIPSILDAKYISASKPGYVYYPQSHSLALLRDGTLMAWGLNDYGQLGDGSYTGSLVPIPVPGLSDVRKMDAGGAHSLALVPEGPHGGAPLGGAVLYVPTSEHPTIQSAIDAAKPGDRVVVAPGTYVENLDFRGKKVRLISSDGPDVTVIEPLDRARPTVSFCAGESAGAGLRGFTLSAEGAGLQVRGATPRLEGNVIRCTIDCDRPSARAGIIMKNRFGSAAAKPRAKRGLTATGQPAAALPESGPRLLAGNTGGERSLDPARRRPGFLVGGGLGLLAAAAVVLWLAWRRRRAREGACRPAGS